MKSALLPDRGTIEIVGADRIAFLQALVSNDVAAVEPGRAVWAALLTPHGRWLADFFIFSDADRLLLDCERGQAPSLFQRLSRFRLRARVEIRDCSSEVSVYAGWNGQPAGGEDVSAPDPRLPEAGWRRLATVALETNTGAADWDYRRLGLGLPDGSRDLEVEKSLLLEAGFDELHGISWTKGCYMGQEVTARMKYRGLVKRRLLPVAVDGAVPKTGAPILRGDVEVGTMRSGRGDRGLALLRVDAIGSPLVCCNASVTACLPGWVSLDQPVTAPV